MESRFPAYQISYLDCALMKHKLKANVTKAAHDLKKQGFDFESIAFRGMSGAVLASPIALALDKTLILVRKGENTHSQYAVEGDLSGQKYIIVDDFISTGETVRTIIKEIFKACPRCQCIGILVLRDMDRVTNSKRYFKLRSPNEFLSEETKHLALSGREIEYSKYYE